MRRPIILLLMTGSTCMAVAQQKPAYKIGNKLTIYTDAKGSNEHFASSGSIELTKKGQPVETELAVFVDPAKTYQAMIGIGGALTDAAAETFYKLPADKQKEFLTAYYDKEKGIGYTFGRTNMQSCDFSSDIYS